MNFSFYLGSFRINLHDLCTLLTCIDSLYLFIDLVFHCMNIPVCLYINCLENFLLLPVLGYYKTTREYKYLGTERVDNLVVICRNFREKPSQE